MLTLVTVLLRKLVRRDKEAQIIRQDWEALIEAMRKIEQELTYSPEANTRFAQDIGAIMLDLSLKRVAIFRQRRR